MENRNEKPAVAQQHRMDMLRLEDAPRIVPWAADDFAVLDAGACAFTEHALRRLADGAVRGRLPVCGQSRNSVCYSIGSSAQAGCAATAVLKQAVISPERTNPDHTFSREADYLKKLARLEIADCPGLLCRFRYCGRHYLLLTFVPGGHPHPQHIPLHGPVLRQLFEKFVLMDQAGFIHYDLQAPNIVISGARTGLIDFEFAGLVSPFIVKDQSYLCDYNVSPNPYVPLRSCVCNFEFRTLYPYLALLRSHATGRDVLAWARSYLACKAGYHLLMAEYFACASAVCAPGAAYLFDGGLPVKALRRGARYERALAGLYRHPSPEILATEYLILKLRFELFERDFNGRSCDLRAGFGHAKKKVRAFARASRNPNGAAGWYFSNSLELLRKLEHKAAEIASAAARIAEA